LLHNTGYIAARKDAVYLPFLVENLKDFLKAIAGFWRAGIQRDFATQGKNLCAS